jgi:Protein of unknown function (DUF3095)
MRLCESAFQLEAAVATSFKGPFLIAIPSHNWLSFVFFCDHDKHRHGLRLVYVAFYSSHTIMTCLVESVADGIQSDYMDGEGGGFAMAGNQLKERGRP